MILYINTKDKTTITVALKKDDKVVKELEEQNEYGSQVLLPMIMKLMEESEINIKDLTQIEVEEGPGSFTGLRVGAAVGQALGYALDIPVNGKFNTPVDLKYS